MDNLFGRYCYIDTPWIAGKKTRYRIIGSGVRSNAWCEVPVTGRTELVHHNSQEDVVFAVLDTLVGDDSIIRRFAAKDIEVIEPPADVRPVVRGRWIKLYENPLDGSFYCSNCKGGIDIADGDITPLDLGMYYCHKCGADMRGGDAG